jgi:hypothetical protein
MFESHNDGTLIVRLDGYAIVPKEKYYDMMKELSELKD